MGKPKAPEAPDYAAAAKEQGAANVNSALATSYLNQQNQVTPQGTLSYNYDTAGGYTLPDGTVIPKTTVTTTLSPEQQKLYDQNIGLSTSLNDLAARGLGYVSDATSNPLNASQFGPQVQAPTSLYAAPNTESGSPTYASYRPNTLGIQKGLNDVGTAGANNFTNNAAQLQRSLNPNSSGTVADFISNNGGPVVGSVGANARTAGVANAGDIQQNYGFNNLTAGPSTSDFAADRDRVTALMMERLQPYLDQEQAALDTKLANQGISLGSTAYGDANKLQASNRNDQRIAALLAGSQEQQRLFQNAMGIRQQGVNENIAQGNFFNAGQAQRYGQNANDAQFNLASSQDDFSQRLASGNFANNANQQGFANQLAAWQANNSAQAQRFGQDATAMQMNNAATGQAFSQGLASANYGDQAQAQRYAQGLSSANFANTAQAQEAAQGRQSILDQNQSQQQQFLDRLGLSQQQFQQALASGDQRFSQGLAQANFNQDARARAIQEANFFQNQPLNILNALRSGNQVSMPQFGNYNAGASVAAAPVYQATQDAGNFAQQSYQNAMAGYGGFLSGLGSIGGAALGKWG